MIHLIEVVVLVSDKVNQVLTKLEDLEEKKGIPSCFDGDSISSELCILNRRNRANICVLCQMQSIRREKEKLEDG